MCNLFFGVEGSAIRVTVQSMARKVDAGFS